MLETPKFKDISLPKGFIWEREFEYIVPLPIDECLNRFKDLAHNMKDGLPHVEYLEVVDGENHRIFIDFSGFRTTTSAIIYFTQVNDTTTQIHGRYGVSIFLLVSPFLVAIFAPAGIWLLDPQSRNSNLSSDFSGLALTSIVSGGAFAIIAALRYFGDRFRASTLIQQAFNIATKPKSSKDGA